MIAVDISPGQEITIVRNQIHQASRRLANLARPKGFPKNPWVSEVNASGHVVWQTVDSLAHGHAPCVTRISRQRLTSWAAGSGCAARSVAVLVGHGVSTWSDRGATLVRGRQLSNVVNCM